MAVWRLDSFCSGRRAGVGFSIKNNKSSVSMKGGNFSSKRSFLFRATAPQWARASSFTRFLGHTQRHSTLGRTPVDEWLASGRDLYRTKHNNHNRQTSMSPGGIRTHNLSRRAATGIGTSKYFWSINTIFCQFYLCRIGKICREYIFINSTVRNETSRRGKILLHPHLK